MRHDRARLQSAWAPDRSADTASLPKVANAGVQLALTSTGALRAMVGFQYTVLPSGTTYADYAYVQPSGASFTREKLEGGFVGSTAVDFVLDANGAPHATYRKSSCATRYARRTSGFWQFEDVTSASVCHWTAGLAVAGTTPKLAVYDISPRDLFFAEKSGASWSYSTVKATPNDVGSGASLLIDSAGVATVVYGDFTAKQMRYARGKPGAWTLGTVDTVSNTTYPGDVTLDALGRPHVCYQESVNDDLKHAYWTGSDWAVETIATSGDVGYRCAIAVDGSGAPHIVFLNSTAGTVQYAH